MRMAINAIMLFLAALFTSAANAQDYPNRAIRFLVPYPPGGTTDILSRLIGQKLSEAWGQAVVIDNRPGANATLASNAVAKATPDGYTIGMFLTPHAVNPYVSKNLPYDTKKDFTPISLVAIVPGLMVTNKASGITNLQEAIALAKSQPGKLNYGSPGPLTSGHISMELLKSMAGIDVVHIPFKGGSPSVMGLMQNQVQFVIAGPPSLLPHVTSGEFVAIAVTTDHRIPTLPNVQTVAEQGLAGYATFEWYGILGPPNLPKPILDKLNKEIARIVNLPDIQQKILEQGGEPQANSPEAFAVFLDNEMAKWKALVEKIHFTIDQQ